MLSFFLSYESMENYNVKTSNNSDFLSEES